MDFAMLNTRIFGSKACCVLLWIVGQWLMVSQTEATEYCITETFSPSCSRENSVILIQRAQYGRMKVGRCISAIYGKEGCYQNVLNYMDSLCSGRKSCDVSISDPALVRTQPCTMDLAAYLDIDYTCEDVLQIPRESCRHDGRHVHTQPRGFISPLTTNHVRHEKRCPLVIRAEPGQRITFVLYDFALRNDSAQKFTSDQYCQQYLIIREPVIGSDVMVCSGIKREREVYVSRSHEVALELASKSDTAPFLLKYEVTGCSHIRSPEGTSTRYDDDIGTVTCNKTRESFTLRCINTTWSGELRNCSSGTGSAPNSEGGSSLISLPPIGISIVIILGVAMVIVVYVAVMIVCVLYIKKKRRRRMRQGNESSDVIGQEMDRNKAADKGSDLQPEERLPMLTKTTVLCSSSSDCLDTCELHEMKPCTVCNNCSTYISTKGLALSRESESAYGPGGGRMTGQMMPSSNTAPPSQAQSPLKQPLENIPKGVKTLPRQSNQGQGPSLAYHPQARAGVRPITVVDSRLFADGPYGFPPSYFKTFAKPVPSPRAGNPSDPGVTSPDIVPEYSTQNSTNAALAASANFKDRSVTTNAAQTAPGHGKEVDLRAIKGSEDRT